MEVSTRIKINLSTRELEVEGSEDFVRGYEADVRSLLDELTSGAIRSVSKVRKSSATRSKPAADTRGEGTTKPVKPRVNKDSIRLNPNLNLRGSGDILSFKAFVTEKNPKKGPEFNAVSVYYLSEIMKLGSVTLSDAVTCYKEIGQRPTLNFKQAFIDTKNKNGWIEIDENDNLSMTARGSILVEHDLPKNSKK